MSQQINLFNPAFVRQRKHFSLVTMLQSLVLIALGSLVFYGYAVYQVEQLGKQSVESTRRHEVEQARLVRYAAEFSPQQAAQALQEEVRRLEKQIAERAELIDLIKSGALGNTSGYSEYMRAFARQVVQGLWLTGFTITGDAAQISLSGAVLSPELLPAYIRRLNNEDIMRGRTFASLQMRQPKADANPAGDAGRDALPPHVEFTLHSGAGGGGAK